MKKYLLFILLTFAFKPSFAQFYSCNCSEGLYDYMSINVEFMTSNDTGCSTPSAGLAYVEFTVQGQTISWGYMSSQDAADICQMFKVFNMTLILDTLVYNNPGGGGGGGGDDGGGVPIGTTMDGDGSDYYEQYYWDEDYWAAAPEESISF